MLFQFDNGLGRLAIGRGQFFDFAAGLGPALNWLTEREQGSGTLTRGWIYRLPTDAEWSAGVRLQDEQGNNPKEKDCRIKLSESPRATRSSSSFSIACEYVQPTWLQAVRTWLQLHTHFNCAPSALARAVCCAWDRGAANRKSAQQKSDKPALRQPEMAIRIAPSGIYPNHSSAERNRGACKDGPRGKPLVGEIPAS